MNPDPATPTSTLTRRRVIVSAGVLTGTTLPLLRVAAAQSHSASTHDVAPAPARIGQPVVPLSVPEYEQLAQQRMTHEAWEFITSGCADDLTVRWNREALARVQFAPRVMIDVSKVDMTITLLGQKLPHPILLAPTASHMLVHPEGEVETARGAGKAGAIMVVSTTANRSVEDVGRQATGAIWFQLYVESDRAITKDLITRAEAAGCRALCLTVDQPVIYSRDRVARSTKTLGNLPLGNLRNAQPGRGARTRSRDLSWRDMEWLRANTKLPLLLKGILHPDDAEEAVKRGAGGIIVSNHGGRALDGVVASIDALPRITDRVGGRIPVLFDGGIRRGTDIVKGLAYGANAVLIGRPYLFGLAVNGAEGVRHVVEILRAELEAAMALCGRTSIAEIDRSILNEA